MTDFKVGDTVRLTGPGWAPSTMPGIGTEVTFSALDDQGEPYFEWEGARLFTGGRYYAAELVEDAAKREFRVGDTVRLADKMREPGDAQRIMRDGDTNVIAYVEPGFIGFSWDGEPSWDTERFELVKSVVNTNEFLEVGEFANEPDSVVVPADIANPFPAKVRAILNEIGDTIIAKNSQYGNSALEPVRIFSKASATEQIKVRMDDKISRLVRGNGEGDEDAAFDLLGYIVLLKIAQSEDD